MTQALGALRDLPSLILLKAAEPAHDYLIWNVPTLASSRPGETEGLQQFGGVNRVDCASCERPSPSGEALHHAVLRGDMAEARRILQLDPSSVRATDAVGMTALHLTVVRLRVSPDLATPPRAALPSGSTP